MSGSAIARLGAPTFAALLVRKGALSFGVVRGVLRALLACTADFHQKRWGPESSQVQDTADVLKSTPNKVFATLSAIKIPNADEMTQQWMSGRIAETIALTERFLYEQDKLPLEPRPDALSRFAAAVNRTYLDAALSYERSGLPAQLETAA